MKPIQNIIDLHCDTIYECEKRGLMLKNDRLRFSLNRLPQGFRLCQAMAVYMPDHLRGDDAVAHFERVYSNFLLQMRQYGDEISQIWRGNEIEGHLNARSFAAILTVEGGSALGGKIERLERLSETGVKMMTLTWNAENEICGGAHTDIGFTGFGRAVVAEMERRRIAVDVSHLSDRGFSELCEFAEKPFAASHSNSRVICGARRNLTDAMFTEIVRRGGVVGLNYCKKFLRDDAGNGTIDDLLRHAHHFLGLGGENTLALGSDFDGADIPDYINGIEKIGFLAEALEKSGIPGTVTDKILFRNANRFFIELERS